MFTGIITDIGKIIKIQDTGDKKVRISSRYKLIKKDLGTSIACSGPCLTVIKVGKGWFDVQISSETLSKTTLGNWTVGSKINLERSLLVGDELSGHLVTGHVDGIANLAKIDKDGDSIRLCFKTKKFLSRFIATKGSISLDGISLTVNSVKNNYFEVNIISHTQISTTIGSVKVGDSVNLEVDLIARYLDKLKR
ncbi:riboflavin synthase [Alphaproteobacteria bacterium]|nr:riboflavin synthase [Alphaproteobacteria bacterium]